MWKAYFPVDIFGSLLQSVENLFVWFDSDFPFCNFKISEGFNSSSLLVASTLVSGHLTTAIHIFGVCLIPIYESYNAFKTVLPELYQTSRFTRINPILRKLYWLAIEICSIFKKYLISFTGFFKLVTLNNLMCIIFPLPVSYQSLQH